MTKEEILSAIAKTDKVINNPTMPEAVKQVAIETRAKYQAQLDAMGGEEPKVEKEEVVEKEVKKKVEKKVVAPKKERVKFERTPRTPKAPMPKKEEETPESKAEKSMEGKKLTVANCRDLLAKLKTRREGAKKRVATRKKQGKPAQLTTIEVLKKASDNLEKKVETEVNKDGKLQKTTITRSTKEVVDIVATIISGIPTKAERTKYVNEVIADLKKLIDKVEPITEKMAKGGYMADGGMMPSITEIRHNGDFLDSYMIDESQSNSNAGEQEVYLYEGETYFITTWNDRAEEHEDGEEEITIGEYAKGGNVYSSDNLYEIFVIKDGEVVATRNIMAANEEKAKEIFEDTYADKYLDKYEYFEIKVKEAPSLFEKGGYMADGGEIEWSATRKAENPNITDEELQKDYNDFKFQLSEFKSGNLKPSKIVGGGYKSSAIAKRVAEEWLEKQIAIYKLAIEKRKN